MSKKILVEVSHRHIHLSKEDLNSLFGENYQLNKLKSLSQSGEFAAEETITLSNEDRKLERVRVIGPVRNQTQIELSRNDANQLKIKVPLKESGDLKNTPGIEIIGPKGKTKLKQGVIIAKRHLHANPQEANQLNLKEVDKIKIKIPGERSLIFEEIIVRINPKYALAIHLDRDEGNAAGIETKTHGEIIE